jgi:hypothetical protein
VKDLQRRVYSFALVIIDTGGDHSEELQHKLANLEK